MLEEVQLGCEGAQNIAVGWDVEMGVMSSEVLMVVV